MNCKNCGIEIDVDTYDAFNGACVDCSGIHEDICREIDNNER